MSAPTIFSSPPQLSRSFSSPWPRGSCCCLARCLGPRRLLHLVPHRPYRLVGEIAEVTQGHKSRSGFVFFWWYQEMSMKITYHLGECSLVRPLSYLLVPLEFSFETKTLAFILFIFLSNKILKWKLDILTSVTWFVFFWCLRQACLTLLDEDFVFNPLCLSSSLYQHLRRGLQSQPWYPYRLEKVHRTSLKWATNHKKNIFFYIFT